MSTRKDVLSDQWYTPPGILNDLARWAGEPLVDYCRPDEDIDARLIRHYKPGDTQFANTPYSKEAGGAESFVEAMHAFHVHNFFLVNYGSWAARVAVKYGMSVGLLDRRVKFVPSRELREVLEAQMRAAMYKKGYDHAQVAAAVWKDSPRYDNVFLYSGPNFSRLPSSLGGYDITWRHP
jgi:hypothetical protein